MFSKLQRRLIKETLMFLYNDNKKLMDIPVYFVPYQNQKPKAVGLAVKSLQTLPVIPWPDNRCIIIAEDMLTPILTNKEPFGVVAMVRASGLDNTLFNPGTNGTFIQGVYTAVIKNRVVINKYRLVMMHMDDQAKNGMHHRLSDKEASITRQIEKIKESDMIRMLLDDDEQRTQAATRYAEYLRHAVPQDGEEFWAAIDLFGDSKLLQPGLAADFLSYLHSIVVPCHYMVRSSFKNGFGQTGEMRRKTASKPIFSVVPYDRLYQSMPSSMASEHHVSPHFRHAHIRHLWKLAGIDRFALPVDPGQRLLLVHQRNVKRILIPPMWVGESEWEDDDVDHKLLLDEQVLNHL